MSIEKVKAHKIAKKFLSKTDWVETYYIKHLTGVEIIPENSAKWEVINARIAAKLNVLNETEIEELGEYFKQDAIENGMLGLFLKPSEEE
jgi:chorismate synthase